MGSGLMPLGLGLGCSICQDFSPTPHLHLHLKKSFRAHLLRAPSGPRAPAGHPILSGGDCESSFPGILSPLEVERTLLTYNNSPHLLSTKPSCVPILEMRKPI